MVTYDETLLTEQEATIKSLYTAVGERFYIAHRGEELPEFADLFAEIQQCENVIARHKQSVDKQNELAERGYMLCAYCGEEIVTRSLFCNFCGKPVTPAKASGAPQVVAEASEVSADETAAPQSPAMPEQNYDIPSQSVEAPFAENGVRICTKCGFRVDDPGALFCYGCGSKLSETARPELPSDRRAAHEKVCPRCGFRTADPEVRFCIDCGSVLQG